MHFRLAIVLVLVAGCGKDVEKGKDVPTENEMLRAFRTLHTPAFPLQYDEIKIIMVEPKKDYTAARLKYQFTRLARDGSAPLVTVEKEDCRFTRNDFGELIAKCGKPKVVRIKSMPRPSWARDPL